jgi:hypothetical protein
MCLGWQEGESRMLHSLLLSLCSNRQSSKVALTRFQEFLEYPDIRYATG